MKNTYKLNPKYNLKLADNNKYENFVHGAIRKKRGQIFRYFDPSSFVDTFHK